MDRGGEGSPCVYVSDCAAALLCRDRSCLSECKADRDCAAGKVCSEARCVDDGQLPLACSYSSECDTERGERCLAGSCLCMCAEDRDCPGGQACDGCGCEVDPNAPESCIYNSDCEIPGQICRDRNCACECRQDSDCSNGSACDGCGCFDPMLPADGVVRGNVTIESSLQLPLYGGTTEILGDLYITDNEIPDFGDTFARLARVKGRVIISGNAKLTTLSFPKLRETVWFSLSNMSALTTLELPALESASLDISSLDNLGVLNVDRLDHGMVQVFGAPKLTRLALPNATSLNGLYLGQLPALAELDLPQLAHVSGAFSVTASALRVLSAPKLNELGISYLVLSGTQLESLDDFGDALWSIAANDLQVTDNPALSNCEIAEFVTRFKAGGFTGSVTATGNLPCPTCQGPNCPN
jgi:hypothetical protein